MKLTIKIVTLAVLTGCVIFCAAFVFFSIRGKDLIVRELQDATQKKVSIDYFALHLPSEITLGNVNIVGLVKARSIIILPNIVKCIFGHLVFDKISLQGGAIDFTDQRVGKGGLRFRVEDLNCVLHNLTYLSHSAISNFDLKAAISWDESKDRGRLQAKGWFDFTRKDIEATVSITDIDGVYLYPYYSGWLDLEKARIDKAKLDFDSVIQGENNNLTALCHLELKDIVFKPRPPKEDIKKEERIVNTVMGVFKAMDHGKMVLDFIIRTRMDRPEFGLANIKTAVEDKMLQARQANRLTVQKAALLPGKVFGGTVKGTTDITKALLGGTLSLGKELKKAFEIAFKKER